MLEKFRNWYWQKFVKENFDSLDENRIKWYKRYFCLIVGHDEFCEEHYIICGRCGIIIKLV